MTHENVKRLEPTIGRTWPFEEFPEPGVFIAMAVAGLIVDAGRLRAVAFDILSCARHDCGGLDAVRPGDPTDRRHRGRLVPVDEIA